ncbi:MAG: phage shock protein PspA [Chromatiales bacterium]|nr:MAG: phage shock protein PspA [Chromatiales bacterium]
MGIFSRMSDIINANINAMLEKAEDPEKIVRLMIQEMEDTLVEVRSAAARAIADKKTDSRKLAAIRAEAQDWEQKAELAVTKGRDDLAKAALHEKAAVERVAAGLAEQLTQVDDGLERLNSDIVRLQEKLADAKARQKALLTRHETSNHRLRVREQLHQPKVDDALMRFEKFERKIENVEGRVEAYDLGERPDLRREIRNLEGEEKVEQALNELKQRLNAGGAKADG